MASPRAGGGGGDEKNSISPMRPTLANSKSNSSVFNTGGQVTPRIMEEVSDYQTGGVLSGIKSSSLLPKLS